MTFEKKKFSSNKQTNYIGNICVGNIFIRKKKKKN